MNTNISFTAPPTVARFMQSEAFFRVILGPVGSGKTTGCIMELLRRSVEQAPGEDGVRHTRWAIVRQTLKQLEDTVLKDIQQWLGPLAEYKVSKRTINVRFGDVESEWLLIPLDDPEDQRRLLSMQLTGAWLSESIEMSPMIVAPILGRCGRYPSAALGKPSWYGAIADTNFPTEGDDWHKVLELETPGNWHILKQPGGMDPDAENLDNLPGGRQYYIRQIESNQNNPDWVKRYIHAQYGNDPSGSAVFRETFKRPFHCVKSTKEDLEASRPALTPSFGYPLIVAQDFGRNPCSLIGQVDHKGRGLILQELSVEDIGLELHLKQNLLPALNQERFVNRPVYVIGDPSGRAKNMSYEETSFDLIKKLGLNAFPAPTNDVNKRIRAVDAMLLQQRDGGPALVIDEELCPKLVMALQGRYRYAKRRNGQLAPLPEKLHPWSDLADCLQYFCLAIQGGMSGYVASRLQRGAQVVSSGPRKRMSSRAWT